MPTNRMGGIMETKRFTEGIQLFKVCFDSTENNSSNAIYEVLLGTFIDEAEITAIGKANKFLDTLPLGTVRIMYDGNIYPYIILRKITIN
jgi:hypothetical protein